MRPKTPVNPPFIHWICLENSTDAIFGIRKFTVSACGVVRAQLFAIVAVPFSPAALLLLYAKAAAQFDLEEAKEHLRVVKEQSALDWFQTLGERNRRLAQCQVAAPTL